MKLFSNEWAEILAEKINNNPEFKNSAGDWTTFIIFELNGNDTKAIYIKLENGFCANAGSAADLDFENAEIIFSADSSAWQKIFNNELEPMQAFLMKKIELKKGSIASLMGNLDAAKELLNSAKKIQTEF